MVANDLPIENPVYLHYLDISNASDEPKSVNIALTSDDSEGIQSLECSRSLGVDQTMTIVLGYCAHYSITITADEVPDSATQEILEGTFVSKRSSHEFTITDESITLSGGGALL